MIAQIIDYDFSISLIKVMYVPFESERKMSKEIIWATSIRKFTVEHKQKHTDLCML